jgi:hypothetical protein
MTCARRFGAPYREPTRTRGDQNQRYASIHRYHDERSLIYSYITSSMYDDSAFRYDNITPGTGVRLMTCARRFGAPYSEPARTRGDPNLRYAFHNEASLTYSTLQHLCTNTVFYLI